MYAHIQGLVQTNKNNSFPPSVTCMIERIKHSSKKKNEREKDGKVISLHLDMVLYATMCQKRSIYIYIYIYNFIN